MRSYALWKISMRIATSNYNMLFLFSTVEQVEHYNFIYFVNLWRTVYRLLRMVNYLFAALLLHYFWLFYIIVYHCNF